MYFLTFSTSTKSFREARVHLEALASVDQWPLALKLLAEMSSSDSIGCSATVAACQRAGAGQQARIQL